MNLDIYTEEMSKSAWDKAFFMDKIPGAKCVIDFGCADGAMIRFLAPLFPSVEFFGYDINDELIDMGEQALPEENSNVSFWRNGELHKMIHWIKDWYSMNEICINFSSVLHEVFSSSPSGKETIRCLVEELRPKYITIRDMYWHAAPDVNMLCSAENKIRAQVEEKYLSDYEATFGFMHSPQSITHFLMKYQWKDNGWEDEMKENYFSYTIKDFLNTMCQWQYTTIFESHYQLPYLTEKWKKEYGFFVPEAHTHAQFILRRN